MIEIVKRKAVWYSTCEIKETETGIEVSAGELHKRDEEIYPVEEVSFDLIPDDTYPVEYMLYLHMNNQTKKVSWSLCKAYLDGEGYCDYSGSERLIMYPVSVTVFPNGTREGTIFLYEKEDREPEQYIPEIETPTR
ncbi:putative tail protein [Bacillus phage 049ML001]|uniref:Putative tail protein n=1 Tax=Bacillus phage 049ML001 TaxID=2601660 RepID=A0A5P8PI52_9CAUD|nr:putative tail protein [Bacillus phage 049ML001]QFR56325.1 putative tail protein [Bacillus phage 049ML001]QFR56407.1 putative tail protein [Bacillus phage 049ML003]